MRPRTPARRRRGATVVEMAVVLPVFGIFLAGLMEINHAYMVSAALRAAAQKAARAGVADGVTSSAAEAVARQTIGAAIPADAVTVLIKDGTSFEQGASGNIDYSSLPNIELKTADPRQLYIVRLEVDYSTVSLVPPFFVRGPGGAPARLSGQAVMRHE